MEVTNEIRVKIFSLYLGATFIHQEKEYKLTGTNSASNTYRCLALSYDLKRDIGDCQIILTPLEQITDEHAIEVAKLMIQHGKVNMAKLAPYISTRTDEKVLVIIENIELHIYWSGQLLSIGTKNEKIYLPIYNTQQICDFLRSKGYALPYMGTDLFESGIAIKAPINYTDK